MEDARFEDLRALVTGGAGFIGSHLVDALLAGGAEVRVLDDLSTGNLANLEHCRTAIDWIEGDIRDAAICHRAAEGMNLVFHQAALGSVPRSMKDPASTVAVNVSGTANIFAAARDAGVRRVVYASSSSVYGDSAHLPKIEGREGEPLSPYALSKVMNEQLARVFQSCFGIELVGLRYFNVFGPRQSPLGAYAAVIPRFFQACLDGVSPVIHGDGEQSRDFTFISDAVEANLRAAAAPPGGTGAAYNVAPGRGNTINEIAAAVRSLFDDPPAEVHVEPRAGDVRHSVADPSRASEALDFRARVDLDEGLRRAREFYLGTAAPSG